MSLSLPFNFKKWIEENKHLLKPPVGATLVFDSKDTNFIIMVIGGPNKRSDYHINQGDEFFYQLQGNMILKVVDNGEFKDIPINEGEIFLLPKNVPHSPQRFSNTVGLVIEQRRTPSMIDKLRWYCDNISCREIIYEESFHVDTLSLGKALEPIIIKFYENEKLRTCCKCGTISQPPN